MRAHQLDVPMFIDGKEVRTGKTQSMIVPHEHRHVLGSYHLAGESEV